MRVALVSPYDLAVPGGVQSHVRHLATHLRTAGDEVVLVGPGDGDDHLGVGRSHGMPFNGSVAPLALAPTAWAATRRRLAQLRPDVVHVHEPLVPSVGLAAATSSVAPVVVTVHAWSDADRLYRLARPLGRRVLDHAAAAVAVSDAAAQYHADALGVSPATFEVVPNGVEVARFAAAGPLPRLTDEDHPPTALFVGRLERRKGLATLLRAFTRVKVDHPELRLVVVGEGPERHRLEELLPRGLRRDVIELGRVPHDDLPGCYAAADLYVSPALGGESFGIVLLEAMAAGRPVVASDLPGYRAVLPDGRAGTLVPPGDPAALADAIGVLLANPSLRAAMGEEGRRVAARYDWPVVTAELRELYRRVAATA